MLFLLSCLSLLLQDKYSEVWPQSVSKRWEKNRKTKRKLKGNMSVTTEAENLEGAGTKISVRQREFCWFTPAAGLAWWYGRGRAGEKDQKLWWWGMTSNPSLLNVTWFSRELALSAFGNQAFSGESSWDIQKSEYARELATVESVAKSINTFAVIIETQEESIASIGRETIYLTLSQGKFWAVADICWPNFMLQLETLLPPAVCVSLLSETPTPAMGL